VTVLFSLKSEGQHTQFLTTFIYHKETKMPFALKAHSYVQAFSERNSSYGVQYTVQEVTKESPGLIAQSDLETGQNFYFDIATAGILDQVFFLFGHSWDVKLTRQRVFDRHSRMVTPVPRKDSVVFSRDRFLSLFERPEVFAVESVRLKQVCAPPKARMRVGRDDNRRWVRWSNPFGEVCIEIQKSETMIGVGSFQELLTLIADEGRNFWTSTY
jgi:hypothetical protein